MQTWIFIALALVNVPARGYNSLNISLCQLPLMTYLPAPGIYHL